MFLTLIGCALLLLLLGSAPPSLANISCYGPSQEPFFASDCLHSLAHLPSVHTQAFPDYAPRFTLSSPFLPNLLIRHRSCTIFIRLGIVETDSWPKNPDFPRMWADLRQGAGAAITQCVGDGNIGWYENQELLDRPRVFGHVGIFPVAVEPDPIDMQITSMRDRLTVDGRVHSEYQPGVEDLLSCTVYDV